MDDHAIPLDAETKAVEMPEDHREELRLWLRLLTCSTLIEGEVRRRLRERFDVTLPRFDLMAQLDKAPDGMTLSDLSKRMMVSNGNLTGLVDRLVASGHIARTVSPTGPPCDGHQPDRGRPRRVPHHGRRARALDCRSLRRPHDEGPQRSHAAARQDQVVGPPGDHGRRPVTQFANSVTLPLVGCEPRHFLLAVDGPVATVTLNRPTRKIRSPSRATASWPTSSMPAPRTRTSRPSSCTGAGGNFSSGGDVFEIIGPLVEMDTKGLTAFTRMTGELVKAMRAAPQPIVAAVDGICAGAGAIVAMASDLRLAAPGAKVAFLFNKVGLAGCDMGACAILPAHHRPGPRRRTALYRPLHERARRASAGASSAASWTPAILLEEAKALAHTIGTGPTYANTMTKRMLAMEWAMSRGGSRSRRKRWRRPCA